MFTSPKRGVASPASDCFTGRQIAVALRSDKLCARVVELSVNPPIIIIRPLAKTSQQESLQLAIRDGGHTTWVNQQDIEWIDAAGDYMCIHARGVTHIMRKTMKALERDLDSGILQRIHRSTIVNIRRVRELEEHINGEYFLTLDSGQRLKLSRTYKDKIRLFR